MAGLGTTPAFQHRPGTAKVRPKREFVATTKYRASCRFRRTGMA
jgi:hypothetical protein